MKLLSVFKTGKFCLSVLIEIMLFLVVGFLLSSPIKKFVGTIETFKNCDSSYVAYDSRKFENNCFIFHGENVKVNLSLGDSIRVKADVYQFLDDVNYDDKSIINKKNIVAGDYVNLVGNQIAISQRTMEKYNLNIGDYLYLNNSSKYEIVFVFEYIHNIKEPTIQYTGDVVFIGTSSENLSSDYKFAVFDNISKEYNEIFIFNKYIHKIEITLYYYVGLTLLIYAIVQMTIILIFRKQEIKNLYKVAINGRKLRYNVTLYGFNGLLLILPAFVSSLFLILFGSKIIGICLILLSLITYLVKTTIMKICVNW